MTALMALLLTIGVGAVAVIHAIWGLGSHWPEASEEALARSVVGDGRRRMPPPWQCFLVAFGLAAMAMWPWYVLGRIHDNVVLAGTYSIAGIFMARGIAGFSARWRTHFTTEPFATRNRKYYSPYCLLLGVGYIALVAGELDR
jgi:hypothetical protein